MTRDEACKNPIIQHISKLDGEKICIFFKPHLEQKDHDRVKKIKQILNFYYNRYPEIWKTWEQLISGKI